MQKKISIGLILLILTASFVSVFSNECLAQEPPGKPINFTATAFNRTRIDLTWLKGTNADYTRIERNVNDSWHLGDGTLIYNSSGTSVSDTGLVQNTHYYYQAWSWNDTEHMFNRTSAADDTLTFSNKPPAFSVITPANASSNVEINTPQVSVYLQDPENDSLNWTIQGPHVNSASGNEDHNMTIPADLITPLPYNTDIYWYVNATDGLIWTRTVYHFTTRARYIPDPPTAFTATPVNTTNIQLSWSRGGKADTTYIERNLNTSWEQGDGILIYNNTGTIYSDANLTENTHYYYKAWSWNATDHLYSNTSASDDTITYTNQPPSFGTPSPSNQSTNQPLNFLWNITISDTEGDELNWTIQCSNGQHINGTNQGNGTKSLPLTTLLDSTTYKIWVNATDPLGSGLYTRKWYTFTTLAVNHSPVFGTPAPTNGSSTIQQSLTWSIPINDPNGDHFNWTIQCSNGQTNSGSNASNGTKSLALSALSYSTYKIWVNATDPSGSGTYTRKWYTFTVKKSGGGGSGGGETNETTNENPLADLSAGEPYQGYVNTSITFDGSRSTDPDGEITDWFWNFGDDTTGTGITVTHTYANPGTYTVRLTITDNEGATNTDTSTCAISQPNNKPPTQPYIYGPLSGKKNVSYTYSAVASDPNNDSIQYVFNWDDPTSISNVSTFLTSESSYTINHSWPAAGRYKVTVIVTDNQTTNSSSITVYINAIQTRGAGYLLDYDDDGIYDAFNSDVTHLITVVAMDKDTYLIDFNGDGVWDYRYNDSAGITTIPVKGTPGFEIIGLLSILAIIVLYKRKRTSFN
jgi:PKD repeat protein